MRRPSLLAPLLSLLLLLSLFSFISAGIPKNAMLLQDVSTLVFTQGEMTSARRSSPVPQMACKGGPCQYAPTTAMCRNAGFDGVDVTWKCEAELPKGVKFGSVDVSCEGYHSRDDEYVLKGSCGLVYKLQGEPTYESEEREEDSWVNRNIRHNAGQKIHDKVHDRTDSPPHPPQSTFSSFFSSLPLISGLSWLAGTSYNQYDNAKNYAHHQYDHTTDPLHRSQSMGVFGLVSSLLTSLFSLAVKVTAAVIILFIIYRIMRPSTSVPAPAQRSPGLFRSAFGALPFSSLFGGGAPSQPSYPPPPPYPGHDAPGYNPNSYDKSYTRPPPSTSQQAGSGYGVMHGLIGGSLLGYLMGRRRAAPAAVATEPASTGWFGMGGTRPVQRGSRQVHHTAPPVNPAYERRGGERYSSGPSSFESSSPKTTETSTAYARTSRR